MATEEKLLTTLEELVKREHTSIVVVDMQNDFCHRDGFFGKGGFQAIQVGHIGGICLFGGSPYNSLKPQRYGFLTR